MQWPVETHFKTTCCFVGFLMVILEFFSQEWILSKYPVLSLFSCENQWLLPRVRFFTLVTMTDKDSNHSNGYSTGVQLDQKQQSDQNSQSHVNRIVFGDKNQQRPPFNVNQCNEDSGLEGSFCDSDTLYNQYNSYDFLCNLPYSLWGRRQVLDKRILKFLIDCCWDRHPRNE